MATTSRLLLIVAMLTVVLAAVAGTLSAAASRPRGPWRRRAPPPPSAADDWANTPLGKDFRGPGFYLSWLKILACLADLPALGLHHRLGQHGLPGVEVWILPAMELRSSSAASCCGFVFLWMIPLFWIGFPLLVSPTWRRFATYVVKRNKQVDNDRQVLTREHLRHWFAEQLGKVGIKMAAEKRDPREAGAAVKLFGRGGPDAAVGNARLLLARQSPGWNAARQILAEAFAGRAIVAHARLYATRRGGADDDRRRVDCWRGRGARDGPTPPWNR